MTDAAYDFLAPMRLAPADRRRADELAEGALRVAREGGDVDAYVRGWVEARTAELLSAQTELSRSRQQAR